MSAIPILNWQGCTAALPDGNLVIIPTYRGGFELWFYGKAGKEILGSFTTEDEAKGYARTWIGDA
jgi:hypothetical protein